MVLLHLICLYSCLETITVGGVFEGLKKNFLLTITSWPNRQMCHICKINSLDIEAEVWINDNVLEKLLGDNKS